MDGPARRGAGRAGAACLRGGRKRRDADGGGNDCVPARSGAGFAWREALARVELRCYAKLQLAQLAGFDPEGTDLPAELQPEGADVAWLIADTFGPISHFDLGREKFPFDFAELQRVSGFEKPDEVFEAIARLDHTDARAVLAMIGKHASDKTAAKAARRSAYKASIRRPALAPRRSPGWSLISSPLS
jgi:hypothetical protein